MAASEAKDTEAPEQAPKKAGRLKLVILVAGALVVLAGGGGAAAWFLGFFGGHGEAAVQPAKAEHTEGEQGEHAAEAAQPQLTFVDLPDVLVNLKSSGKRPRFLKLKVALEAKDARVAEHVKLLTPRIMDGFQLYLRALDADEIQGSQGMLSLKEELLARINQAIAPSRINDVLFKEILVQ